MPRERSDQVRFCGPYRHGDKYRLRRKNPVGKSTWVSFDTKEEAIKAKRAAEKTLATTGRRVSEAVDAYLAHLKEIGSSPRTVKTVTNFLAVFLPDPTETLGEIGPRHYEAMRKRPGRNGTTAAATHHRALGVGKSFLRWCQDQGWIRTNALASVKPVGKVRKGKPQLRIDEARRWLVVCERLAADNDGALGSLLALQLAMRVTEICERQVRDLDDGGRVLMVKGKGEEIETPILLDDPELPPEERESLRPLRELLIARAKGKQPGQRLLKVTPSALTYWTWKICDLAGVPRVCPHALRGMHSTFARERGVTPAAVARTLRHTEAIDRQHYAAPGSTELGQRRLFLKRIVGSESGESVPRVPGGGGSPSEGEGMAS